MKFKESQLFCIMTDFFCYFQFLKKLNRQERVVEEVKLSLKPHYTKKHITKEEYKDILRRSVPKVSLCNVSCNVYGEYKLLLQLSRHVKILLSLYVLH